MSPSLKIIEIKAVPGQGAYYYEDVTALQNQSVDEDQRWRTPAETEGFRWVREVEIGRAHV